MGRLVTRQTILVLFIYLFFSHLNLGACAGFALSNCDWLGRTTAFYQVFFQQGRVALGKWCIGPQKGHPRTPAGWSFFVQFPGLIFSAWRWSGPATSASMFSVFLDYILWVCQSLWDSFVYQGKLHWFLHLLIKECCFRVRATVRVDTNPNRNITLTLTLKRYSLKTRDRPRFRPLPGYDPAFYWHPVITFEFRHNSPATQGPTQSGSVFFQCFVLFEKR